MYDFAKLGTDCMYDSKEQIESTNLCEVNRWKTVDSRSSTNV